ASADQQIFWTVRTPYADIIPKPPDQYRYDVQLWVARPGTPTPVQVGTVSSAAGLSNFAGATAAAANLYFEVTARSRAAGTALWMSDGTGAGTRALTGPGTAYPDLT